MKHEHTEIIEAMAFAYQACSNPDPKARMKMALRHIAAERGYRLAKLPERKSGRRSDVGQFGEALWNACLDAIETIEMEDE